MRFGVTTDNSSGQILLFGTQNTANWRLFHGVWRKRWDHKKHILEPRFHNSILPMSVDHTTFKHHALTKSSHTYINAYKCMFYRRFWRESNVYTFTADPCNRTLTAYTQLPHTLKNEEQWRAMLLHPKSRERQHSILHDWPRCHISI